MKRIVLFLCAVVAAVSLTACGDNGTADNSVSPVTESSAGEVSEENTISSAAATLESSPLQITEKLASVEEYLAIPQVQDQMDALSELMESMGMTMTVAGEGNKLIYTYTYVQQIDAAAAKPQLESGLDAQESTMKSVASSLKLYVDVENPIVVVHYLNADGSEIYTREFNAES